MESEEQRLRISRLLKIGRRYHHRMKYSKAIDCYNTIINEAPSFTRAYVYRAISYRWSRRSCEAHQELKKVIRKRPRSAEAYLSRGILEYDQMGDGSKILKFLTEAIHMDPDLAPTYEIRGLGRGDLEDVDGAIEDFTACLEREPDNAYVHFLRAYALKYQKRYRESIKDFETYLELSHLQVMDKTVYLEISIMWSLLSGATHAEQEEAERFVNVLW